MCGISGFYFNDSFEQGYALDAVKRMNTRMKPRGPDADGTWLGNCIVLGHTRLAIQDLDVRSNQPFISDDGRYTIVFNGEIYNFMELKKGLESKGIEFRTKSDTEVLLEMYAYYGVDSFKKLRGMFAIGIWDNLESELVLARDPYGIKPLYYTTTAHGFIFSSQLKAILATNLTDSTMEPAGVAGFYLWGSVPEPWTLYQGIFSLPSGSYLKVKGGYKGSPSPILWDNLRSYWNNDAQKVDDIQDIVRSAVTDSVRAHLVSDVPVGVFLSAGVDSSAVAAIATETGASLEGITISFDEFNGGVNDEVPEAKLLAEIFGIRHHVRKFTQAEFTDSLDDILDAMDQPSIDGINTWFASKAAKELGLKTVLSGVGGDEIFCGYSSFRTIHTCMIFRRLLGDGFVFDSTKKIVSSLLKLASHPKLKGVAKHMGSIEGMYFLKRSLFLQNELRKLMGDDAASIGIERLGGSPAGISLFPALNDFSRVSMLETTIYLKNQLLRDSDWAGMAHSVEVRTPLADVQLLRRLSPYTREFAGLRGKRLLGMSPDRRLPHYIMGRKKTGFSTPIETWIKSLESSKKILDQPEEPWGRSWSVFLIKNFLNGTSK